MTQEGWCQGNKQIRCRKEFDQGLFQEREKGSSDRQAYKTDHYEL